jgi:ABC-type lipoprotein release transport system permease subunit
MARRQATALVVLAIVGGLGLGFVMTAASGARRADTAYSRLRHVTLAPDGLLDGSELSDRDVEALASMPGVRGVGRFSYTPVAPSPLTPGVDAGAFVGLDPDFLSRVDRPLVVQGRLADPDAGDEVVVNETLADSAGLRPGQEIDLVSGFDQPAPIGSATVVGVVRGTFDVGANAGNGSLLLSRAFLEQHREGVQLGGQPALLVRLAAGDDDLPAFERAASAALGRPVVAQFSGSDEAVSTERTLDVQTIGLGILALVAGLAVGAAVVQATSRVLERALADLPILVAVGVRPRHRVVLGGLVVVPVAVLGGLVGAGVAYVASPLIPTGFARSVDPTTGHHLDVVAVAGVVGVWTVLLAASGVTLAWRQRPGPVRPRRAGRRRGSLASLPPRVRLGCEAALVPANREGGVASRSALVSAVVGVAGVVAVVTFGSSLTRLLDTPRLQGWSFDAAIVAGDTDLEALRPPLASLSQDDAVREVAWVTIVEVLLGGAPVESYAFDPDGGRLHPTMRSGRPPLTDDEVAVGADLLRAAGLSLGDTVEASGPSGSVELTIVGTATYPELGNNGDLGHMASLTRAAAQRVGAPERGSAALVGLRAGRSPAALDRYADVGELVTPFRVPRVRNLEEVGRLPWLLAAFVSALAVLAVAHGLWSSARARRRELAVLVAIGFRPRDIRGMHLWQAACIAVVGAVLGLVGGIFLGTSAWSAVATATAVVDRPVIPVGLLGLVVLAALVTCHLIGRVEAGVTRRVSVARGLQGD